VRSRIRANPTEVWNKVVRRRKGSRTWRLAGGERSTRFESDSQYSQLPLQVKQSRKTEGNQGTRCRPQGKCLVETPERSNPNRELVNRILPSGSRRHIRKRGRQLSRAFKEKWVRKHQLDRPGFGSRLRTGEGFRMRRLAGGERSTRFEPASQHSQLPLLRIKGPFFQIDYSCLRLRSHSTD
jgi:hypothetical protein